MVPISAKLLPPPSLSVRVDHRRRPPPRTRSGLAGLLLMASLLAPGACERGSGDREQLSREEFVATYVELRRAEIDAASPADFQERKAAIMERYETSGEELLAFIEAHSDDVAYLAALWDSVQARLEEQAAADQAAPESEGSGE